MILVFGVNSIKSLSKASQAAYEDNGKVQRIEFDDWKKIEKVKINEIAIVGLC